MKGETLDDFAELSSWTPVASGQARLDISRDRGPRDGAMRLDFDFKGGGGFVVARKRFAFPLPDAYAFTFDVRGMAPANKFEFKLVDPGGYNVWRYQEDAFDFPAEWRSLRIRSSQIDFAWGPAGSGPMHQVGAIEFAVTAPPGGKGTLWLANLCLEDHTFRSTPAVQASSALPGHEPRYAVDRRVETSWRSEPSDEPQWFLVDFGEVREYGGLIVRWDATTTTRPFDLETSDDGAAWKTVYSAGRPDAARSYVYLPHGTSRQLRLRLRRGVDGKGIGIAEIDVRPYEFSRSLSAFFQNIAANEPRGLFPRYLCGEQTYWTPVGSALGGVTQALLNEDGLLEVDRGTFSIEPFLYVGEELVTWADGSPTQELEQGFLPIPSSVWRKDGIALKATAFATGEAGKAVLYIRYRLENLESEPRRVRFFAALRPFQVTPPWQAFNDLGGVSRITTLEYATGAVWVNRRKAVIPLTAPSGFGVVAHGHHAADAHPHALHGPPPRTRSPRASAAAVGAGPPRAASARVAGRPAGPRPPRAGPAWLPPRPLPGPRGWRPREGRHPEPARRGQGNDGLPAIHPHGARRVLERRDATHAAEVVEGLPGRRHLERAQGREEAHPPRLALQILESVPYVQDGLPRLAGREGGGLESDAILPPHGRRDGKESLLQLLCGGAVSPGDELLADVQKGLDRERASVDLEQAVFVQEGLRDASEGAAHRGPVGLLSAEVSGEESPGLVRGDILEERTERARELVRPDVNLGDADSLAVDAAAQAKPELSRRAVGQVDVAARRVGAPGRVDRLPCRAVVGGLEVERPRCRRRVPADDQPSIFAHLPEIDEEPLRLVGGLTAPARLHATIDGVPGLVPRQRTRRLDGRRRAKGVILEAQVGEPERALPPRRRRNRELDRADLVHGAAPRRSPGEIDLAAPDPQGPPLRGEVES